MSIEPNIEDKYDRLEFLMKKSDKKIADIADFIGLSREHLYRQIKTKKLSEERIGYILEFISDNKNNKTETKIITPDKSDITSIRKGKTNGSLLVPYYEVDFYAGIQLSLKGL